MDVLEELKKARLMVLARSVPKDVLLKAALFVLALMPAENVQAFDSLTTRWTFGAHEPITMYRRKGVRTTGGIEGSSKWVASWLDWFDTESPKLMKELGLNWCHCRFYKGMGWEFEKRDFPNVKRFVDAAHANGVGTLAYIQFMTLYYENMLAEIPNLRDWAARDHEGKMMYYYGGGYYRWVPCISCDEWIDYLVPIMRFAVTEGGFDGVMFDNAFSRHCHCERCQRKFREHLAKLPNAAERFGFDDLRFALIPPDAALDAAEIKDALVQEWLFWRHGQMNDIFAKFRRELKKANPNAVLSCNSQGARNPRGMRGLCVNVPELLKNLDLYIAQNGDYPNYDPAKDQIRGRARILKIYRTMGVPAVALCDNDSNMTPEQEKFYLLPLVEDLVLGGMPTDRTIVSPGADCFYDKAKVERRRPLLKAFNDFVADKRAMLEAKPYEPVKLLFTPQATILSERCHRGLGVAEEICLRRHVPFGYLISRPDELAVPSDTQVIVISDQTCLSDFQRERLVAWAKAGGKMIVTGDSGRCDELNRQHMKNPFKAQLAGLANVVWRDEADAFKGVFDTSWVNKISAPKDCDRLVADLEKVGFTMPYELKNIPEWIMLEARAVGDGYALNFVNYCPSRPMKGMEVVAHGRTVTRTVPFGQNEAAPAIYQLFEVGAK